MPPKTARRPFHSNDKPTSTNIKNLTKMTKSILETACVFDGDLSLPSKKDPSWRMRWPRVVLRPETIGQNGRRYRGWYWLCYSTKDEVRVKLLPVCGYVAPRIGNEDVSFSAVSIFGKRLKLIEEESGKLLRSHHCARMA